MRPRLLPRLARDKAGGTLVEFGLLAPILFALMFGIFAIGMQMRNYNALRSVSAEVSRFAMIEYQKANSLSTTQIQELAAAMATRPEYGLAGSRLDVLVTEEVSSVAGAKKFTLNWTYYPYNPLKFVGVRAPQLAYGQDIYVRDSASE